MLSILPQFLDFSVIAITVLRIFTAILFLWEGREIFKKRNGWANDIISGGAFFGGLFLAVGFLTQATAILLAALSLVKTYRLYQKGINSLALRYQLAIFFLSLSFLFFGPGMWSFDYPL